MNKEQFMYLVGKTGFKAQILEKDYMLTKFLEEISRSSIKNDLAFKGGTALNKLYFGYYRLSEDIDFTAITSNFEKVKQEVFGIREELGMKIRDCILSKINFTSVFEFVGPLGYPNTLKVDISFTEKPFLELLNKEVKHFYELPKFSIQTMQLKELLAEKICALMSRNEPRDYFDVWYISRKNQEIFKDIGWLVKKKSEMIKFKPDYDKIFQKVYLLENYWEERLKDTISNLPAFEKVIKELRKVIKDE